MRSAAGTLLIVVVGTMSLAGMAARFPGSPFYFLNANRAGAMRMDAAVAFGLCALILVLRIRNKAPLLRAAIGMLLLLAATVYPFVERAGISARVEQAALDLLRLPHQPRTGPQMPLVIGMAFGAWGIITVLDVARRRAKSRSNFQLLFTAACAALLITFGLLTLLHYAVDLPLNGGYAWGRSITVVPPESAGLFALLGLFAFFEATRELNVTEAQRSSITGIFAAASMLLLFVGLNVTLEFAFSENLGARQAVREVNQSRDTVEQLTASVRDAESGQRGYLLTGNEGHLATFYQGYSLAQSIAARRLAVGDDWTEVRLLRTTVSSKLNELNQSILLQHQGHQEQARALVKAGVGQQLMNRIVSLQETVKSRLQQQTERRNAAYGRSAGVVSRTVFASYGIAAAFLLCIVVLFRGELRRRAAVETKLRANEADLEVRIADRTSELQASENRYRALLDQSPVAAHIFASDGMTISVNPAFERMFNVTSERMRGFNVLTDPTPDRNGSRELLNRAFLGHVASTGAFRLETGNAGLDEPSPWLEVTAYPVKDFAGAVVEVAVLCHDVTSRETALQSLRENEAQFRQLADSLPQMIWTTDAKLKPLYFNSHWYDVTGWPRDTLAGDFFALTHPDDHDECMSAWARSVATQTAFELDYRLFDNTRGEFRWYLARAIPFRDQHGNVKQWFGSCTDIHDQKEAEAILETRVEERTVELQRSNQLLRSSEEALRAALRERETLFKEVHHRVKNNLQIISSLLRMKGQALHDQPAAALALEESRRRVQSMAFIHESLYSHGTMDRIDFAAYTGALVRELIYSYATPNLPIESSIDAEPIDLNVEQAIPCGLILNELVTNALKYAFRDRSHGTIFVSLKHGRPGNVTLRVHDDGVGLPHDLDPAVLESLGLPIVEILSRQIGGQLEIDRGNAEQNLGASFTIEFPQQSSAHRAA